MIEQQIVQAVVASFARHSNGITDWYHEVPHPDSSTGGRADLVARLPDTDGALLVVECKARLSLDLMLQGFRWLGYAHHIALVFLDAPKGWKPALVGWFMGTGIGAVTVDLRTGLVTEHFPDQHHDNAHGAHLLSALLTPARDGSIVPGGSAGGRYVTQWEDAYRRMSAVVQHHPGRSLEAVLAMANVDAGTRRERDAVVDALRRLEIPGVIGRKFGDTYLLYPGGRLA